MLGFYNYRELNHLTKEPECISVREKEYMDGSMADGENTATLFLGSRMIDWSIHLKPVYI